MIIYRVWGWTADPRSMSPSCSNRQSAEQIDGAYVGRYQDGAWAMRQTRFVHGVGYFFDRLDDHPAYSVRMEGPNRVCQGLASTRWYVEWVHATSQRYAWARRYGFAIHVGPREYLIRT